MNKKGETTGLKAWLIVLIALLDDIAALVLVFVVLWLLDIRLSIPALVIIGLVLGTIIFFIHRAVVPSLRLKKLSGAEGMIGAVGKETGAFNRSGELEMRARTLEARLAACDICPRECGADRLKGKLGHCNSGFLPIVSSVGAHHGEEPVLSGTRGAGAIFFGNCNMRCVYCQNHQISQDPLLQKRNEVSISTLAERMLFLQDELHCHNINLVTPSHFVPQIVKAVLEAAPKGLRLPLVYNTSSYDSVKTLRELDGIISIYLDDIRYASNELGRKYSRSRNYVDHARAAIIEMQRQVGGRNGEKAGIAQGGLVIRHPIL